MTWPIVELGELMATRSGSVDPAKHPNEVFDLYSVPAFDSRQPEVVAGRSIGSTKQIVETNDVLLSKIVPHIRRAWIVGAANGHRMIGSSEWIVFRNERIFPPYLRHYLVSDTFHPKLQQTISGVGGSLLRARPASVAKLRVPLPPLPEQRRIAAILDQAEELRAKRRASLALLDKLPAATFVDMFGDPTSNPMSWPTVELGKSATFVGGGTPSRARPEYFAGPICWATSKDMKGLFLDDTQEHATQQAIDESAAKLVPAGTILIVVKSKVLMHHLPVALARVPVCFGQDLKGIRTNENFDTVFVLESLRINQRWLLDRARGINTEGLTLDHLRAFPLFDVPTDRQRRFASHIRSVEGQKGVQRKALLNLNAMVSSLQHQMFGAGQ